MTVDFADIFKDLDYTTDSCFILKLASFMIQKVNDERERKNRFKKSTKCYTQKL